MIKRTPVRFRRMAVAAAAVVLSGAAAAAQEARPWRHGIIEAKSDSGILFMAHKGGFARKLGLDLQVVQVKTDQIGLKALLAGELDGYGGGPGGAILAAARGADVRIIGCHRLTVRHGIFVRQDIASVEQLRGKSIAVSSPVTMPEILARGALARYGVPVAEVKLASLGGDLDRYKALLAGIVQGAVVSAEYVPVAARSGLRLLVQGREALPNFLRICLHASPKVIAERRADAVRFLAAEMQALHHAMTHKDETIRLARELTGAKEDDPRPGYIFNLAVETRAVAPELPIPLERLAWLQDQLASGGSLKAAVDINTVVDGSLRAEALAQAGH